MTPEYEKEIRDLLSEDWFIDNPNSEVNEFIQELFVEIDRLREELLENKSLDDAVKYLQKSTAQANYSQKLETKLDILSTDLVNREAIIGTLKYKLDLAVAAAETIISWCEDPDRCKIAECQIARDALLKIRDVHGKD